MNHLASFFSTEAIGLTLGVVATTTTSLLSPTWVQLGFAGLCFIMVLSMLWLGRFLLTELNESLKANTKVLGETNDTMRSVRDSVEKSNEATEKMRLRMAARPCLMKED